MNVRASTDKHDDMITKHTSVYRCNTEILNEEITQIPYKQRWAIVLQLVPIVLRLLFQQHYSLRQR